MLATISVHLLAQYSSQNALLFNNQYTETVFLIHYTLYI